jgi:serine/threonine-protein kinase RIO1
VLLAADGPVIIDFPQAVDPARNQSARKLLLRDVKNLTSFLGRFAPELRRTQYGPEMWDLYERSELDPDTELTGRFKPSQKKAEVTSLLEDILELEKEAKERREALGLPPPRRARRPIVFEEPAPPPAPKPKNRKGRRPADEPSARPKAKEPDSREAAPVDAPKKRRRRRKKRSATGEGGSTAAAQAPAESSPPSAPKSASTEDAPAPRRRRRRRRRGGSGGKPGTGQAPAGG